MKNYKPTLAAGTALLMLAMASGLAQAKNQPVSIISQVNELVQQLDADGQARLVAVAPDKIVPGDRILYTTRFQNDGVEPSDNIVITNPIPSEVRYLAGTAYGENCDIVFSVDGGQHWGKPEQLQVRMADGQLRAAQAGDYTHIRWQYQSSLATRQSSQISYQAQLK